MVKVEGNKDFQGERKKHVPLVHEASEDLL